MKRILIVIGTRPEAIKMAPVIKEFKKYNEKVHLTVVSTGQHREMLQQVLKLFSIEVDIELKVMKSNQTLSTLTSVLFKELETVVKECNPSVILSQGDTTTAMVAFMVAFYNKIKYAHVEAGLRTDDVYSPHPEELNRRIIDIGAQYLFAPTEESKNNLLNENVDKSRIYITGNTVIDALLETSKMDFSWENSIFKNINKSKNIIITTTHRRENFGDGLHGIFEALKDIALRNSNVHIVFPVHLNPNIYDKAIEMLSNVENITLMKPFDYFNMIHLMKRSCLIITDSGGIQEEAPTFGVKTLITRDSTERVEGVKAGVTKIIGNQKDRIVKEVELELEKISSNQVFINPYGDGKASKRIVEYLINN